MTEIVRTTAGGPFVSAAGEIAFPGAARQRSAAHVEGARLHLIGGKRTVEQHDFRAASFVDEHVVADLARGEARIVGQAPDSRRSAVAVGAPSGGAFAVGGFGPAEDDRGRSLASTLQVRSKPPSTAAGEPRLPLPLTQFGAFRHGDALYVVGGLDDAGGRSDAFRLSTTVFRAPTEPAVGGMADSFRSVADCESLDLGARRRELFPSPRRPRISPELLAVGGRLFLCGGLSDRGEGLRPDPSIEVYDPVERRWSVATESAPLTGPHVGAAVLDDRRLLYWTTFAAAGVCAALAASPAAVPGVGVVQLDLSPFFFVAVDGPALGVALDATGTWSATFPAFQGLTSPLTFFAQAATVGVSGLVLSNGLAVTVVSAPAASFSAAVGALPVDFDFAEDVLTTDVDADVLLLNGQCP